MFGGDGGSWAVRTGLLLQGRWLTVLPGLSRDGELFLSSFSDSGLCEREYLWTHISCQHCACSQAALQSAGLWADLSHRCLGSQGSPPSSGSCHWQLGVVSKPQGVWVKFLLTVHPRNLIFPVVIQRQGPEKQPQKALALLLSSHINRLSLKKAFTILCFWGAQRSYWSVLYEWNL